MPDVFKHQYSPRARPWGKAFKPDLGLSPAGLAALDTMRVPDRRSAFVAGHGDHVFHVSQTYSEGWTWKGASFDISSLLIETNNVLEDVVFDKHFYGEYTALGAINVSAIGKAYAFKSNDFGVSWERRYIFDPKDHGHPSPDGFWTIQGKRTFPTARGVVDVITASRRQEFFSGPFVGQTLDVEFRLFGLRDGVLEFDEEVPREVTSAALGQATILPLSAWQPRWNMGYIAIETSDENYHGTAGGELIYRVNSGGVVQTGSLPAGVPITAPLGDLKSILLTPELNLLYLSRGGDEEGYNKLTYTSFSGFQTFSTIERGAIFTGGKVQRKTDVIDGTKQNLAMLRGAGDLNLPLWYTIPMDGVVGEQRESTRAWRRQARGLHFGIDG